jgi:hypothetical protein
MNLEKDGCAEAAVDFAVFGISCLQWILPDEICGLSRV